MDGNEKKTHHRWSYGGVLLKTVIAFMGNTKNYPHHLYCYFNFLFSLVSLLSKGMVKVYESLQQSSPCFSNVYDAWLWE